MSRTLTGTRRVLLGSMLLALGAMAFAGGAMAQPSPGPRGSAPAEVQMLVAEATGDGNVVVRWDHPYPPETREMYCGEPSCEPAEFQVWRMADGEDRFSLVATLDARTTEEYLDTGLGAGTHHYHVVYYDGVPSCAVNEPSNGGGEQCEVVAATTLGRLTVHATPAGPAGTEFNCEFYVRGHDVRGDSGIARFFYAPNGTFEPSRQEIAFEGTANDSGGFDFVAGPFAVPAGDSARANQIFVSVTTENSTDSLFTDNLTLGCEKTEVPFFPTPLAAVAAGSIACIGAAMILRRK